MRGYCIFFLYCFRSDEEAVKLIEADVPTQRKKEKSQWNEVNTGSILFTAYKCILKSVFLIFELKFIVFHALGGADLRNRLLPN